MSGKLGLDIFPEFAYPMLRMHSVTHVQNNRKRIQSGSGA